MSKRKIIGLMGPRRAGKDETGNHLAKTHGFVKMAFADLIYAEVMAAWGVSLESLTAEATKEKGDPRLNPTWCRDPGFRTWVRDKELITTSDGWCPVSPRWALQHWGQYKCETVSTDYWIDAIRRRISSTDKDIVITDVRTLQEIKFIHKQPDFTMFINILPAYPGYVEQKKSPHATDAPIWVTCNEIQNDLYSVRNVSLYGLKAYCDWLVKHLTRD